MQPPEYEIWGLKSQQYLEIDYLTMSATGSLDVQVHADRQLVRNKKGSSYEILDLRF
jgi:hypothetical protein